MLVRASVCRKDIRFNNSRALASSLYQPSLHSGEVGRDLHLPSLHSGEVGRGLHPPSLHSGEVGRGLHPPSLHSGEVGRGLERGFMNCVVGNLQLVSVLSHLCVMTN